MSLWYDKKGKTYASKGSSSWVKYYAEHLFSSLTARLEGHYKGAEGKHRAEDVLIQDSESVADALRTKVDKIAGMGLSQEDFSPAEKKKLAGIDENATAVGAALPVTGAEVFNDYQGNTANIPYGHLEGRSNNGTVRGFYITGYTATTVTLDSVTGIEVGMPWYIFIDTPTKQERYAGYVEAINGKTLTVTSGEMPANLTPSTTPSFFGTFLVNCGEIGSFEVTDTAGDFSVHIEGKGNRAFLDAHAEGTSVFAGYSSHAEGRKTKAVGQCSHAEGYGGSALKDGSHAEGASCKAGGSYSHAEGYYTEANERFTHAEGQSTKANGDSSHAEGYLSHADGQYAHAEGNTTTASGEGSHAEGNHTEASGIHSHSEGSGTKAQGVRSHAEGDDTIAFGKYSHAEGIATKATGVASHAEGNSNTASGKNSHAEGYLTEASGTNSHAEGGSTTASAYYAHAEGESTKSTANASHAEGGGSIASANYAHAEGLWTVAASESQHAEGRYNIKDAAGKYAHIVGNGSGSGGRSNAYTLDWEGNGWFAGNVRAEQIHAEAFYAGEEPLATKGYVDNSVADAGGGDMLRNVYDQDRTGIVDDAERLGGELPGYYAKQADMENRPIRKGTGVSAGIIWDEAGSAFGSTMKPDASGNGSFAANFETRASGNQSAAFGGMSSAAGELAFVAGEANEANGYASFAAGSNNAAGNYQTVVGKMCKPFAGATGPRDNSGSAFLVGVGSSPAAYANGFRVSFDGFCYGQNAFAANGADYAEFFEWADQNPEEEDRRGCFVTLEGDKIRKATPEDSYILGIVSAAPVMEGNVYADQWQGMYQTDLFGARLTEKTDVPESVDPKTGKVVPAHTETRFLLNPDYDPDRPYLGRNQRPEWSPVGMLGQLTVTDDGSCQVNGFCTVGNGGIGTRAEKPTPYRVMERLDGTHIRVLVK